MGMDCKKHEYQGGIFEQPQPGLVPIQQCPMTFLVLVSEVSFQYQGELCGFKVGASWLSVVVYPTNEMAGLSGRESQNGGSGNAPHQQQAWRNSHYQASTFDALSVPLELC